MNIIEVDGKLVIHHISKDELDLDKTFNCGQAFRWKKHTNGFWYGVANNQIVVLKQTDSSIATNLTVDKKDWLINYLNLDMDYTTEMSKIDLSKDDYLSKAYEAGKGIHILRQDLYEMIITFVISQMNSMNNIRNCVNKLSKEYGVELHETLANGIEITGYTFPTAEVISKLSLDDLRSCSVGFRDKYIYEISNFICNVEKYIPELKEAPYDKAMRMLKSFNGIGDKVANCVCLLSLHHVQAFPIDTHIKQIINKHYSGNLDISKYGNIAGIAQQYMFYYKALCKED